MTNPFSDTVSFLVSVIPASTVFSLIYLDITPKSSLSVSLYMVLYSRLYPWASSLLTIPIEHLHVDIHLYLSILQTKLAFFTSVSLPPTCISCLDKQNFPKLTFRSRSFIRIFVRMIHMAPMLPYWGTYNIWLFLFL